MIEATRDALLREMAENRGCRLVKSRRRKPGAGDYGRYGLKDAGSGEEVFGFGKGGLTATAEEIEAHLRGGALAGWKTSLRAAGGRAKAKAPRTPPPPPPAPKRSKAAPPAPELRVRAADSVDAGAIAPLLAELGFAADGAALVERLARLARLGEPPLIAKLGEEVVGCLTWHVTPALHRPHPVGRVTMLIVAAHARRRGVASALIEAAEARVKERGCGLIEATSLVRRKAAHKFYLSLGWDRTSYRFARRLDA